MLPVEHDPLGDGDDAILCLVQCAQLRLDGFVGVGHLLFKLVRYFTCNLMSSHQLLNLNAECIRCRLTTLRYEQGNAAVGAKRKGCLLYCELRLSSGRGFALAARQRFPKCA